MNANRQISSTYQKQSRYEEDNLGLLYIVNSKDRTSGTITNSVYTTSGFPTQAVKMITLESIEFPFSFYIFNSTNNVITFNEGGSDLTATITPGNYTETQLAAEIKTQMEAAGALTYTVTYSDITLKLTIAATGAFSLNWANSTSLAYKLLGWNNANTSSSATQVAPNALNIAGTNSIYISIRNWVQRNITSSLGSFSFKVPVNTSSGDIIFYTNNSGLHQPIYSQNVGFSERDLQVTIYDDNFNIIDTNGVDYTMSLRFTFYLNE